MNESEMAQEAPLFSLGALKTSYTRKAKAKKDSSSEAKSVRFKKGPILCSKAEKRKITPNSELENIKIGVTIAEDKLTLVLPIRTVSEANCFEPWQKKYKRHKAQKKAIYFSLNFHREKIKLPVKITLTRFAPRKLDYQDNLPMSFKYITDQVCDILVPGLKPGRADDDGRIKSFTYNQIKSKDYFIKIELDWSNKT